MVERERNQTGERERERERERNLRETYSYACKNVTPNFYLEKYF